MFAPMKIELLPPDAAHQRGPELDKLLIDAVAHGASVGFLHPLSDEEAATYWRKVLADLPLGNRLLFGAFSNDGRLIGTAQLAREPRANGRHRAEVQKVLVDSSARRRGVGAALMARLEREAVGRGVRLLFLDTSDGPGGAVEFYRQLGYSHAGGIPDYAADPDGSLFPNAIFYKLLPTVTSGAPAAAARIDAGAGDGRQVGAPGTVRPTCSEPVRAGGLMNHHVAPGASR